MLFYVCILQVIPNDMPMLGYETRASSPFSKKKSKKSENSEQN